jgi:uncharacterized protein YqeY
MINLEIQVNDAIKASMKIKDLDTLNALRGIKANFDLLNTTGKEISDDILLKELSKMIKQRNESADIYQKNNREDLYLKEKFEISVIEKFLPQQLTEEQIMEEVKSTISQLGATNIKEMGKVMGIVSKKLIGKADNKIVSEIIKKLLS